MENFSRKGDGKGRSVSFVLAEARRDPAASLHIASPRPAEVVFGCLLHDLERLHDDRVVMARTTRTEKDGSTKLKAIRKDQHTLCTVILSHPYTVEEVGADPLKRREVERWEELSIAWLKAQFGNDLVSIIRHTDEKQWHLHAYALPGDPSMKASLRHPGQVAKAEVLAAGARPGEDERALIKRSDRGYKTAMRLWQDGYHQNISVECGLTRLGPARRRLSREEWQLEQTQAKALQNSIRMAQKLKASGEDFIARTKNEAAAIHTAAKCEREKAAKAATVALAEQDRAQKAAEKAISLASRYIGFFGKLRAMWDGLTRSKLADRIRQEISSEIEHARAFTRSVQDRLRLEERHRRDAERKAHEAAEDAERARDLALRMRIERDRAWSHLPPERLQELAVAGPVMKMTSRPPAKKDRK